MNRIVTIVWFRKESQTSNLTVTLKTQLPRDDEECRLFGVYEASSAKEHTAASRLLNWHDSLSHPVYMKLLGDLRAIRTECNDDMLAIAAHHNEGARAFYSTLNHESLHKVSGIVGG